MIITPAIRRVFFFSVVTLLCLCLLWGAAPFVHADEAETFPPYEAREIEGALLEFDRGIPVVHVWGKPRERGERLGKLLKPQIEYAATKYVGGFVAADRLETARSLVQGLEATLPRYLYDEMRGIADGAEVDFRDILLLNTFVDTFQLPACSALGVEGTHTSGGKALLARNLDWPSLGGPEIADIILVIHPKKGPAVLSITWPGMVGIISGINAEGLCAAMLVEPGKPARQVGMPNMLAYRDLLQSGNTVEDASAYFDENLVIAANNLVLADAAGGLLVMEIDPWFQGAAPRRPEDGILISTDAVVGAASSGFEDWCYNLLLQRTRDRSRMSFLDLRAELQKVAPNVGATRRENMQSMIFEPEASTLYLSMKNIPAADGKFLRFKWDKLFSREMPKIKPEKNKAEEVE